MVLNSHIPAILVHMLGSGRGCQHTQKGPSAAELSA